MSRRSLLCIAVAAAASTPPPAWCDDGNKADVDNTIDAAEADDAELPSERSHWNEVDLKLLTMRVGGGALFDWRASTWIAFVSLVVTS